MPSTAELDLLYADNKAAHGRAMAFTYKPVAGTSGAPAENALTGAASSFGYITGTITCVCHDIRPSFEAGSGKVRRIFGILASDLDDAGVTLPCARGSLSITDTASGQTEKWVCDAISEAGDRKWIEVGSTLASGPRVAT